MLWGGEVRKEQVFGRFPVKIGTAKLLLISFVLLRCRLGVFFLHLFRRYEEWRS